MYVSLIPHFHPHIHIPHLDPLRVPSRIWMSKKKDAKKRKFTLSRKAQRTQRHLLRWGFSSIDSTRKPGPLGRLGTRCFSLARDFNGRTTCSVFECRFSNSGFFSNSIFMLCGVSIFFLGSPQSKLLQSDSVLRRPRNRHRFD